MTRSTAGREPVTWRTDAARRRSVAARWLAALGVGLTLALSGCSPDIGAATEASFATHMSRFPGVLEVGGNVDGTLPFSGSGILSVVLDADLTDAQLAELVEEARGFRPKGENVRIYGLIIGLFGGGFEGEAFLPEGDDTSAFDDLRRIQQLGLVSEFNGSPEAGTYMAIADAARACDAFTEVGMIYEGTLNWAQLEATDVDASVTRDRCADAVTVASVARGLTASIGEAGFVLTGFGTDASGFFATFESDAAQLSPSAFESAVAAVTADLGAYGIGAAAGEPVTVDLRWSNSIESFSF